MKTLRINTGGKSMTFYEIGRKLGISQTSARLIYQNGMIKLKRLLEKKKESMRMNFIGILIK